MFLRRPTKPRFLCSQKEAESVIQGDRAILAGNLVLVSNVNPGEQYVRQPDRHAVRFSLFSKPEDALRVWIDRDAFAPLRRARVDIRLAFDHYLMWGLRQQKPMVLVGGSTAGAQSYIGIFVFGKGRLEKHTEQILPAFGNKRFPTDFAALLDQVRTDHDGLPVVVASPIDKEASGETEYVGMAPFDKEVRMPVVGSIERVPVLERFAGPLLITLAGAAIYGAAVALPWWQYDSAVDQYKRATSQLAGEYQFGSNKLRLMEQRQAYLDAKRRQDQSVALLSKGIRYFSAVPGVIIKQAGVNLVDGKMVTGADGKPTQAPDIELAVALPRNGQSAIDQAAPLLSGFAAETGLSARLAMIGWRDLSESAGGKSTEYRIYFIEANHAPYR